MYYVRHNRYIIMNTADIYSLTMKKKLRKIESNYSKQMYKSAQSYLVLITREKQLRETFLGD